MEKLDRAARSSGSWSGALFVASTRVAVALVVLAATVAILLLVGVLVLWRWRREKRNSRFLSDLAASAGLRDVMLRTLAAAKSLPGADAALISVGDGESEPLTESVGVSSKEAEVDRLVHGRRIHSMLISVESDEGEPEWVGLTREEVEAEGLDQLSEDRLVRSMLIRYEPGTAAAGEQAPISVGLAVPIRTQRGAVGVLSIFSRTTPSPFAESDLRNLEAIARTAAQFIEVRQQVDFDELTHLPNYRSFKRTLAYEVAGAQRYNRRLGLLAFDLDGFKEINDTIGHDAGDVVLFEVARRVRRIVRRADIPCRKGGDEFVVLLPDSGLEDADRLYERLQHGITMQPINHEGRVLVEQATRLISAGATELRREDDAGSPFDRADQALLHAKDMGKGVIAWGKGDRFAPPPEAGYDPGDEASRCGGCNHLRPSRRDSGYCERWNAPVEADHVCRAYEPRQPRRNPEAQ